MKIKELVEHLKTHKPLHKMGNVSLDDLKKLKEESIGQIGKGIEVYKSIIDSEQIAYSAILNNRVIAIMYVLLNGHINILDYIQQEDNLLTRGSAEKLFEFVIEKENISIISSSLLTTAGENFWLKFKNHSIFKFNLYDAKLDKIYDYQEGIITQDDCVTIYPQNDLAKIDQLKDGSKVTRPIPEFRFFYMVSK